jgi:imidazolonepropionase
LIIALAALYMNLSPEEILTALTLNSAAALDRVEETGSIDPGKKADILILDYPSYKFLPYYVGVNIVKTVIKDGKIVQKN